jgi:hypothetical protein
MTRHSHQIQQYGALPRGDRANPVQQVVLESQYRPSHLLQCRTPDMTFMAIMSKVQSMRDCGIIVVSRVDEAIRKKSVSISPTPDSTGLGSSSWELPDHLYNERNKTQNGQGASLEAQGVEGIRIRLVHTITST